MDPGKGWARRMIRLEGDADEGPDHVEGVGDVRSCGLSDLEK
jgi:hypothetical protein